MFGSIRGNATMDSAEFAKDFLTAFDVHIMNYQASVDSASSQWVSQSGMGLSYNGPSVTTLHINCRSTGLPVNKPLFEHFSLGPSAEHVLVEVKTSSNYDSMGQIIHTVDLTYKTTDFNKFMRDLRNVAYARYSDKFHKQLDDILD